jgi:hypothetical protein
MNLPYKYTVMWLLAVITLISTNPDVSAADNQSGKTKFLSIGTAPPGGVFYVVGGAIAEVLNESTQNGKWNVTAESTMGTQENIRRLTKGEVDIGMANASITYFAVRGGGEWKEKQPIQSVMTLAPNIAFFITPAKSGVKTIADLKGKRVVIGPPGAGFDYFVEPILKAHGLTLKDLSPLYATQSQTVDMMTDGSAAAAFLGGAIPTASISQACTSGEMFFIPFDEQARQKLIADYPFFGDATVPANTYKGQTEKFVCLNVGNMQLITSAKVDADLVYMITKTLYESREQLAAKHTAGRAVNPQNVVRNVGTEFHPGAIRYYKEAGLWKE